MYENYNSNMDTFGICSHFRAHSKVKDNFRAAWSNRTFYMNGEFCVCAIQYNSYALRVAI